MYSWTDSIPYRSIDRFVKKTHIDTTKVFYNRKLEHLTHFVYREMLHVPVIGQ